MFSKYSGLHSRKPYDGTLENVQLQDCVPLVRRHETAELTVESFVQNET